MKCVVMVTMCTIIIIDNKKYIYDIIFFITIQSATSSLISSGTCSPIDDTLLNTTAKRVDGGIRRMVFPKEVCYHLCFSTFTQMTNQYTRTLGVSSTQTTCVLRHRLHHLRRPNQLSAALDSIGDYYEKNHLRARQDTDMRIPPQEQKSEQTAEHIMVWKKTGTYSIPNLPGSYF